VEVALDCYPEEVVVVLALVVQVTSSAYSLLAADKGDSSQDSSAKDI